LKTTSALSEWNSSENRGRKNRSSDGQFFLDFHGVFTPCIVRINRAIIFSGLNAGMTPAANQNGNDHARFAKMWRDQ
jgi:hypothetical protein